jgi:hypothetical protein
MTRSKRSFNWNANSTVYQQCVICTNITNLDYNELRVQKLNEGEQYQSLLSTNRQRLNLHIKWRKDCQFHTSKNDQNPNKKCNKSKKWPILKTQNQICIKKKKGSPFVNWAVTETWITQFNQGFDASKLIKKWM